MNDEQFKHQVMRSPLAAEAEAILATLRPSIRISAEKSSMNLMPPGSSRFGGIPDLPESMPWPENGGRRLEFLAQVDLCEAAQTCSLPSMPSEGWLAVFYDTENQPWGFDPADTRSWRIVHFTGDPASLRRVAITSAFQVCELRFEREISLPDELDSKVGIDLQSPERRYAYGDLLDEIRGAEEVSEHRLGGFPTLIQEDLREICQMASNGIYCGGPLDADNAEVKSLRSGIADWDLLLQLDSDEEGPGWMWGDAGKVYFCMRRSDLAQRDFAKSWLILQCH